MKKNIYEEPKSLKNLMVNIVIGLVILIAICCFGMIIYDKINESDYITEVNITYYNDKTETLYYKEKQNFTLDKGDLGFNGGRAFRSYVKSYTFKYHEKIKKDGKK